MRFTALTFALTVVSCAAPTPFTSQVDGESLRMAEEERTLARFQYVARVPEGVDAVYARAGYLHPIFTPSGAVVTGDYCASHPHQHGVFFAWTRTRFEGRNIDFWNAASRQGSVDVIRVEALEAHADRAGFQAWFVHDDITNPREPRMALEETWRVLARSLVDATVIDLESIQSAGNSPLDVLEYHYGGFAVRGPEAWEGADGARALTSEGLGRIDGNGTTARWAALCGPVGGEAAGGEATIAVLASPENPRAPEPVRIHPSNPYFCFSACQQGAFSIVPGAPRRTRYRIVAMDGPPDVARLEELWREFAALH